MAAKREQTIWPNLWDVCERLENSYPLKALCSAGILALSKMEATGREQAMAQAKLYPDSPADVVAEAEAVPKGRKRKSPARKPKTVG